MTIFRLKAIGQIILKKIKINLSEGFKRFDDSLKVTVKLMIIIMFTFNQFLCKNFFNFLGFWGFGVLGAGHGRTLLTHFLYFCGVPRWIRFMACSSPR